MADNIKLNETVDLIGFSMGGMVAQEKTLHSDKIRKLVLFSTHCGNSQPSKEAQKYYKMPDGDKKIELGIKVRFPEKWIMENAEQVKEYVQFQKGLNFNETLGLMHSNAIESWDGVCDEIKNIKVPTLVIVGDKDEITWTNNAKYIQGQIPDSELTVIKNSGHGLIYQYPDVISRKILDFLR